MDKKKLQRIATGIARSDTKGTVKSVEVAQKRIQEMKGQIEAILSSLNKLREDVKENESSLTGSLNQKLDVLRSKMAEYRTSGLDELGTLSSQMDGLKVDIKEISQLRIDLPNYENQIGELENNLGGLIVSLKEETEGKIEGMLTDSRKTVSALELEIKKLRSETISAMANRGGGNMNRNILVGNNPLVLGRYTDLNLKAGTNITLSYQNNDNLKTTDLTIAATGGGGTSRSISTVSVSSVVAAPASTDMVVIAGAGVQLTLPTAVGNMNLYTIKNKAASSVLVIADGAETIDGQANVILATQYVSIDLISDNANWQIT